MDRQLGLDWLVGWLLGNNTMARHVASVCTLTTLNQKPTDNRKPKLKNECHISS